MGINMVNKALSEQIRTLRMSKKYTLAVMAERLGVTTSTIAAYENGSRNPSFDILIKIARMFNVTVDMLLGVSNKDLIDVSDLVPEQRDKVEHLISTYRKFNLLFNEILESKENHRYLKLYFDSNFEEFKIMLLNRNSIPVVRRNKMEEKSSLENNEEINKKEDKNNEDDKVKNLEDRIKILEEMIKNNRK